MNKNLIENALNLFFPLACGFCGEITNSYLCEYCSNYLETKQLNKISIYEDKFFTTHLWLFEYKDEVREKIIDYKFNDKSYLYRTFAQIILADAFVCNYIQEFDVIIPIPIHKKRLKLRGYNQSELCAREISKRLKNVKIKTDVIEKIKNIKPQSTLTKEQRIENVNNAYRLIESSNNSLKNKKILLIDDVYTTGSTVNECARMLQCLNCAQIGVLTLAKD